jgi:hypothetical protein
MSPTLSLTLPYKSRRNLNVLTKIRSHASFSNVVAVTALFVALGGTSYAATRIGSKQIKNNSVRSVDIKNRTIKSRDIARGVIGATLQSTAAQVVRDAGPTGVGASTNYTAVATLGGLEPGAYVLLAKVNQSATAFTEGRCRIQADGDVDDSNRGLRPQGTPEGHNLQLVHTFGGSGTAVLACRAADGAWTASDAKLLAIRISAARSSVVSG